MSDRSELDRRRLLATLAAAAASTALPETAMAQRKAATAGRAAAAKAGASVTPAAGRGFFTQHEFATLDEIAEMIIPADQHSGGARAAKVAEVLDRRIGASLDPEWRQSWRDDLAEIDSIADGMFGKTFLEASPAQRTRLLERISRNEKSPKEAGEYAFGTIKWSVGEVYYRTAIGIHDEMDYQGNVAQDEFSGVDVSQAPARPPAGEQKN